MFRNGPLALSLASLLLGCKPFEVTQSHRSETNSISGTLTKGLPDLQTLRRFCLISKPDSQFQVMIPLPKPHICQPLGREIFAWTDPMPQLTKFGLCQGYDRTHVIIAGDSNQEGCPPATHIPNVYHTFWAAQSEGVSQLTGSLYLNKSEGRIVKKESSDHVKFFVGFGPQITHKEPQKMALVGGPIEVELPGELGGFTGGHEGGAIDLNGEHDFGEQPHEEGFGNFGGDEAQDVLGDETAHFEHPNETSFGHSGDVLDSPSPDHPLNQDGTPVFDESGSEVARVGNAHNSESGSRFGQHHHNPSTSNSRLAISDGTREGHVALGDQIVNKPKIKETRPLELEEEFTVRIARNMEMPNTQAYIPPSLRNEIGISIKENQPLNREHLTNYPEDMLTKIDKEIALLRDLAIERGNRQVEINFTYGNRAQGRNILERYKSVRPKDPQLKEIVSHLEQEGKKYLGLNSSTLEQAGVPRKFELNLTYKKITGNAEITFLDSGGHGAAFKVDMPNGESFVIKIGNIEAHEATALVALKGEFGADFPSPTIYDYGDTSLVMEYFKSADSGGITGKQLETFLKELTRMHDAGLFHGDIKKANLKFTERGIELIDLGRVGDDPLGSSFGSQPPESIYSGGTVDMRAGELYTVGRAMADMAFPDDFEQALEISGVDEKPGYNEWNGEQSQFENNDDAKELRFNRELLQRLETRKSSETPARRDLINKIEILMEIDPRVRLQRFYDEVLADNTRYSSMQPGANSGLNLAKFLVSTGGSIDDTIVDRANSILAISSLLVIDSKQSRDLLHQLVKHPQFKAKGIFVAASQFRQNELQVNPYLAARVSRNRTLLSNTDEKVISRELQKSWVGPFDRMVFKRSLKTMNRVDSKQRNAPLLSSLVKDALARGIAVSYYGDAFYSHSEPAVIQSKNMLRNLIQLRTAIPKEDQSGYLIVAPSYWKSDKLIMAALKKLDIDSTSFATNIAGKTP